MEQSLLSLKVPGPDGTSIEITAPPNIPTTGLGGDGGKIIGLGIALFLIVAVLISLGFMILGGGWWITSGGDKIKLQNARRTVIFAGLGLIICFLAIFLVTFIGKLLGVNFLEISL